MNNKEYYINIINASPLFSLDRDKEPIAYRTETDKIIENIYRCLCVMSYEKYQDFGLEIIETIKKCLKNYDPSNGEFFTYFMSSWKMEYRRACSRRAIEERQGGLHITDEDQRNIKKLTRYMNQKGIEHPNREQVQVMSDVIGLDVEKVEDLLQMQQETMIASEYVSAEDDEEEVSIFDTIGTNNLVEGEEQKEKIIEILDAIEMEYEKLQERTKPIISKLLTIKTCDVIVQEKIPLTKYSFINQNIIRENIVTGYLPTQREIAEQFEKNEASISRSYKIFCDMLDNLRK